MISVCPFGLGRLKPIRLFDMDLLTREAMRDAANG